MAVWVFQESTLLAALNEWAAEQIRQQPDHEAAIRRDGEVVQAFLRSPVARKYKMVIDGHWETRGPSVDTSDHSVLGSAPGST
jgi:hypothetical protein